MELMRAIPTAAENPAKNSFGNEKMGLYALSMHDASTHQRATVRKIEVPEIVASNTNETPPTTKGMWRGSAAQTVYRNFARQRSWLRGHKVRNHHKHPHRCVRGLIRSSLD